jgi:hypothetical protein
LENIGAELDINRTWENNRENINISAKESPGYYKLKKHKPCVRRRMLKNYDQRRQAKLQRLHDPTEINVTKLNKKT